MESVGSCVRRHLCGAAASEQPQQYPKCFIVEDAEVTVSFLRKSLQAARVQRSQPVVKVPSSNKNGLFLHY